MNLPRQAFALASVSAFTLLGPSGCSKPSACVTDGTAIELSGNHGHTTTIPAAHVAKGIGGLYPIAGGDHAHALHVRDEDLAKLKTGEPVSVLTTSVNAHTHQAAITCKQ